MKDQLLKIIFKLIGANARQYLKKNNAKIIGVTGSVGKTSCRMIISQIVSKEYPTKKLYTSPNNYNSELGMSLSILEIEDYHPGVLGLLKTLFTSFKKVLFFKKSYDFIAIEYGIDHKGDMDFLLNIARPDVSVFTKVDKVHGAFFSGPDEIAEEKIKLSLNTNSKSYLNNDDEYARQYFDSIECEKSFYNAETDPEIKPSYSNYEIIKEDIIYSQFQVNVDGNFNVKTNVLGKENATYIALAYDIANFLRNSDGLDDIEYQDRELTLKLQPGRLSVFEGINGSIIIDSSYNAAPLSMKKVIENVYNIKQSVLPDYNIILALGEMRELGEFSEGEHRELAGIVSGIADRVVLVGQEMKAYLSDELDKSGFEGTKDVFLSSRKAGEKVKEYLEENGKTIVLFKGSQNTIFMEEGVKLVLKNKKDENNLCRKSKAWKKIKEDFFS